MADFFAKNQIMPLFIFFIILISISPSFGSEGDPINTSIDTTSQGNEDIAVNDPESSTPEPIDITPTEANKSVDEEHQDAPETITRDYTLDAQPINAETQIDVLNRKIEGLEKKIEELEEALSQKEAGATTQTKKEQKDDGHSIDSFNSSDASADFEKIKQMAINKNPEIDYAVELFKKNHKGNTLCAKVHFFLADYWYSQKDYPKTLELIKKGLSEYKGSKEEPKAVWLLGLTFHEMGQKKESCVAFKKLESLKDVDADLKTNAQQKSKEFECH